MAKWGEGDPRWIVEDRPDSTNVNNWHWYAAIARLALRELTRPRRSELNCLPTVQAFVKKHLVGIETLENGQRGSVTSVSDVKGDATMVNRKGKVRTFFDLTITCEVQGAHRLLACALPPAHCIARGSHHRWHTLEDNADDERSEPGRGGRRLHGTARSRPSRSGHTLTHFSLRAGNR